MLFRILAIALTAEVASSQGAITVVDPGLVNIIWSKLDYSDGLIAAVGDRITFSYQNPHNVYLLADAASFASCDFTGSELLSEQEGEYTYQIKEEDAEKSLFFSCSVPGHCSAGQKLKVEISTATASYSYSYSNP